MNDRDKFALKTRFPEECKRLPMEYLTSYEQELAEKCMGHDDLTDDELTDLKQLLADYRPFLKKYDSVKLEENIEENVRVIKSASDLLRLLDNPNRYRFDMHYKIEGELCRLELRMKPLSDHDYMELLDAQARVFRELDKSEKLVYSKATNNMPLSPEEEKMQQHIQDKIVETLGDLDANNDIVLDFLVKHVELVDDTDLSESEREKFWGTIDVGTRALIYNKCKELAKIDEDLEVDLFPSIR